MTRLLLIVSFCLTAACQVFGDEHFTENGFVYSEQKDKDHSAELIGFERPSVLETMKQIHIPASVVHDGMRYEIKRIGQKALDGLTTVETIIIDDGINAIGDFAFEHCTNLRSIYIPASVSSIGYGLFGSCYNLTTITIDPLNEDFESPKGANAIIDNDELLVACSATKIPSSVTRITRLAFYHCNTVEELVIPEGVEVIESEAFLGCSCLKRVMLPESLHEIGVEAFCGCHSLDSVFIPRNVSKIIDNVFLGCNNLSSIVVDEDNQTYDSRSGCNAVVRKADSTLIASCAGTTISEDIKRLGDGCFCGVNLHTIRIPKSIERLSGQAFDGCNEIDSLIVAPDHDFYISPKGVNAILTKDGKTLVVGCRTTKIPDNIEKIGNSAFAGRFSKLMLHLPEGLKEIGQFAFTSCNAISDIIIPSSVESIGSFAFARCQNLKAVQIPLHVKSVASDAFFNCEKLRVTSQ